MRIWAGALLTMATMAASGGHAAADFILNGSFEQASVDPGGVFDALAGGSTAITGWTVTGNSVDYTGGFWQPSDGRRSVDLSGSAAGGLQQSFATTAGLSYLVRFDLAGNPQGEPAVKALEVSAAGQVRDFSFDTTGRSLAAMGWTTLSFQFTATGATTTLGFASLTGTAFGPALDNVRVELAATAVPEPPSLALCGLAGLAGLGYARRGRRPIAGA